MYANSQRLAAFLAAAALILIVLPRATLASDDEDASAHVLQAEIALHRMEYREAAAEYRKAAELSSSVDIARQATRIGSSYGFHEDALRSAERWLELEPDSDEALFHRARLQLRLGSLRKAERSYRELLERGDGEPDEMLLSLTAALGEEPDTAAADELMRELAEPYEDESAAANYAMAVIALQADELDDARGYAKKALELDPDEKLAMRIKLLNGRIMMLSGDEDEAIEYVARIIGDDPRPDPSARMELALLMLSAGRDDDALSQVNQIQYETGSNAEALRLMAIINFRQENLDAAREDFEDLLASGQYTMDALYYLARIADYRGDADRAIRLYSGVTQGSHAVLAQRRAAGLIAVEGEAPAKALDRLDEFAREQPQYAIETLQSKAQLLVALGRHGEALEYYDKLADYRPDDESVVLGRAELLLRMDRLDDSIAQYRRAVKRWPESPLSLNALGYTLADRTDRYREAEKLIRKALEYDPDNAAIIDSMGWVLFKRGQNEEALEYLQRAYELFDDPEVAAHIVEVLVAMDREQEAMEVLVAAESKRPESELLRDVRERLFADAD